MPDWRKRTAIIGGFNQASASLIAWEVQQRSPHAILDLVDFPRWVVRSHPADDAKLWVGDWMCAKGVEQIVAIRLLPDCPWRSDPDYLAFNAWQLGVIDAVEASPRWAPVRRARVAELALEIILFAPAHQRDAAGTPRSADGK